MGYHVRDKDERNWVLGAREIVSKSATDSLDTFKDILADI